MKILNNSMLEWKGSKRRLEKNSSNFITNPVSTFMDGIYTFLKKNDLIAQQYFFIWIELFLNKLSREILPTTINNYVVKLKEARTSSKNVSSNEELETLRLNIDNAYFGLEHILREFGQLYEATMACDQATEYRNLPSIFAKLILNGQPFELMDGDASFVPITWVGAVFEEIKNSIEDKKISIISVIGIQSSGKSTLLNTMFGLKFPVSCERWEMEVDCDFVLVRGLCTRILFPCQLLDWQT